MCLRTAPKVPTRPSRARPSRSGTVPQGSGWYPGGTRRTDSQQSDRQVCTAACEGRSDGRLERDDVCAFDQVFVLPVDQGVPLVKVLVEACETHKHNSAAETHDLPLPLVQMFTY